MTLKEADVIILEIFSPTITKIMSLLLLYFFANNLSRFILISIL